jgi:hypothetical protein
LYSCARSINPNNNNFNELVSFYYMPIENRFVSLEAQQRTEGAS